MKNEPKSGRYLVLAAILLIVAAGVYFGRNFFAPPPAPATSSTVAATLAVLPETSTPQPAVAPDRPPEAAPKTEPVAKTAEAAPGTIAEAPAPPKPSGDPAGPAEGDPPRDTGSEETSTPRLTGKSRMAVIDMKRLFQAHPKTKPYEEEVNAKRQAAREELERLTARGDAEAIRRFRETKEKEIGDEANRLRKQIADEIQQQVRVIVQKRDLGFVFDVSGHSLNGAPTILNASGILDLTDEVAKALQQ